MMTEPSDRQIAKEDSELMKFFLKRAKKADAPLCKGQICEEYKEYSGSKSSEKYLRERFVTVLTPRIAKITNYNIEDLAKLYFVTSLIVDKKFLQKLRETAKVEIDDQSRIVKFEGKIIKFEGSHAFEEKVERFNRFRAEKEERIRLGTVVRTCSQESADSFTSIITENTKRVTDWLAGFPEREANEGQLSEEKATSIDQSSSNFKPTRQLLSPKDKMNQEKMKDSSVPVPRNPIIVISLDSENEVSESKKCESVSDSEQAELRNEDSDEESERSTESDESEILEFLAKKAKNSDMPLIMKSVWKAFVKKMKLDCTPEAIHLKFRKHLAPKIHKLDNFDINTKVRMLFASSTPVDKVFFKELTKRATVKLDEDGRIIKYKANRANGLKLKGSHRPINARKTTVKRAREESDDSDDDFFPSYETIGKTENGVKKRRKALIDSYSDKGDDQPCSSIQNYQKVESEAPIIPVVHSNVPVEIGVQYAESPCEAIKEDVQNFAISNTFNPTDFQNYHHDIQYEIPQNPPLTAYFVPFTTENFPSAFQFPNFQAQFVETKGTSTGFGAEYYNTIASLPSQPIPTSSDMAVWTVDRFIEQMSGTISLKSFLKELNILVMSLDTPLLSELSEQIKGTIEKIGESEEQLPVSDIYHVLKTSLVGVSRKFRSSFNSTEASIYKSAKEFLKLFKCLLYGLESSSLSDLLNQVIQTEEITSGDQIVLIVDIQQAIQNILSTISR